MRCPRRTSWWFPLVLPGSPLPVVSLFAGPSRWAAEARAEECPSSFVVEAMGEPDVWGTATWPVSVESACPGSKLATQHPGGKYKHTLGRWLVTGQDPSIVLKEGFSTQPEVLYSAALDSNIGALQ